MRKVIFLFLLAIVIFVFGDCQKKLFKGVSVKGRIISFITNQPVEGILMYLSADDITSGKQSQLGSVEIANGKTNSDGVYNLKGRASRRNNYYLNNIYEEVAGEKNYGKGISLKGGHSTKDLGDFTSTVTEIKYKINVVLSNGFKDTLIFYSNKKFTGGQSVVFFGGGRYTKDSHEANNHKIKGFYSIKKGSLPVTIKDTSYNVPITSNDQNEINIFY